MGWFDRFKSSKDTTPVSAPAQQPTGSGTTATPAYPRDSNAEWKKAAQGYSGGYLTRKKAKTDLLDEAGK